MKRRKDEKTKRQKDKKTKRRKDEKTKRVKRVKRVKTLHWDLHDVQLTIAQEGNNHYMKQYVRVFGHEDR
jgi:hypothetical protein